MAPHGRQQASTPPVILLNQLSLEGDINSIGSSSTISSSSGLTDDLIGSNSESSSCCDDDDNTNQAVIVASSPAEVSSSSASSSTKPQHDNNNDTDIQASPACEEDVKVETTQTCKKKVQFGLVYTREYNRIIGDNPETNEGPPLSIDWCFVECKPYHASVKRNGKKAQRVPPIMRREILQYGFGYNVDELEKAEKHVAKIAKQRCMKRRHAKYQERLSEGLITRLVYSRKGGISGRGSSRIFGIPTSNSSITNSKKTPSSPKLKKKTSWLGGLTTTLTRRSSKGQREDEPEQEEDAVVPTTTIITSSVPSPPLMISTATTTAA